MTLTGALTFQPAEDGGMEVHVGDLSPFPVLVADRHLVRSLGKAWQTPGIYVLVGPPPAGGLRAHCYVGQVERQTLAERLLAHHKQKRRWERVLAWAPGSSVKAEHLCWLERHMHSQLDAAPGLLTDNISTPPSGTPSFWDLAQLSQAADALLCVLGVMIGDFDRAPVPHSEITFEELTKVAAAVVNAPDRGFRLETVCKLFPTVEISPRHHNLRREWDVADNWHLAQMTYQRGDRSPLEWRNTQTEETGSFDMAHLAEAAADLPWPERQER